MCMSFVNIEIPTGFALAHLVPGDAPKQVIFC